MKPDRLNALTDGVVAFAITVMVLDIHVPHDASAAEFRQIAPIMATYVLSFLNIAIFWNNHHLLTATIRRIDGRAMWANMGLLFFLSLLPFSVRWLNLAGIEPWPCAIYGIVLLGASLSYLALGRILVGLHQGETLDRALGGDAKGIGSAVAYAVAVGMSFFFPLAAVAIYVLIALLWIIPDRRIEQQIREEHSAGGGQQ